MTKVETTAHVATAFMALLGAVSFGWQLWDWSIKRTERVVFATAGPVPNPETATSDLTVYVSNLSNRTLYIDKASLVFRYPNNPQPYAFEIPVAETDKNIPEGAHRAFIFHADEGATYHLNLAELAYFEIQSQTQQRFTTGVDPQLLRTDRLGGFWGQIQYARAMKADLESKKVKPVKPPPAKAPAKQPAPNTGRRGWR